MENVPYLAITGREPVLPPKPAWMACRFASNGTGLENLPQWLPEGAVLMVDDSRPPMGHDPQQIAQEVLHAVQKHHCSALLLDFQKPDNPQTENIAQAILEKLPDAVLSLPYANGHCGIFLPPVPLTVSIEDYLLPYKGRDIWLEATIDAQAVTVTAEGTTLTPCSPISEERLIHQEPSLFCHYYIDIQQDTALFHLQRTKRDLHALIAQLPSAVHCVGFYEELHT